MKHATFLPQRQRGLSLVEVMVAMAIGSVILGAIGYLFVGSKQTSSAQADLLRMQESGRNSMATMGRALRQAGYKIDFEQTFTGAIGGTDGGAGATGAPPVSDVLLAYHDPLNGLESNCEGATVTANNAVNAATGLRAKNTALVAYRFFVGDGGLRCSASNPASATAAGVVVAENIENLQVSYSEYNSSGELVSYSGTPRSDAPVVRVSVLVRGNTPGLAPGTTSVSFGGATLNFSDGYLRRVYTSTFTVRNQAK